VNHRQLISGRGKTARFKFLTLPEVLQDEIIAGLDSCRLTFLQAQELAKGQGHQIADTGIHAYYRQVVAERQKHLIAAPLFKGLEGLSDKKKVGRLMSICVTLLAKLYHSAEFGTGEFEEAIEMNSRLGKAFFGKSFRVKQPRTQPRTENGIR
jgi:hypothetical protein